MTLAEIKKAGVNGEHPDGWFWSAFGKCIEKPAEIAHYALADVPQTDWQPAMGKAGLKPW